MRTELGLIFGLPGRDRARPIAETIAFVRGLRTDVEVAYGGRRPRVPEHAAGPDRGAGAAAPLRRARARGWRSRRVYSAVGEPRALARRLEAGVRRPAARRAHGRRATRARRRRCRTRTARRWPATARRGATRPRAGVARAGGGGRAHPRGVPARRALARALRPRRRPRWPACGAPTCRRTCRAAGLLRARVVLGAMGRAQGLRRRLRTSSPRG